MRRLQSFLKKLRHEYKPKYNIKWWTDNGEEIKSHWWNSYTTESLTLEEIERKLQSSPDQYVTHVKIEGLPPRSLHQWLPTLTHLYIRVETVEHANAILDSVSQLTELRVLHLESDHVSLPSLTSGLLNEVDRMNQLPGNQESLKLCKLQILEIVNCNLNVFDTSAFLSLFKKSLTELTLQNCSLTQVPESISQMTQLRKLDLSSNNMSAKGLPNMFDCLPLLDTLNIADCYISTLPTSFKALGNLKTLDLSRNNFEKLPRLVKDLQQLESLLLHENLQLISLDFILSMPNLKHLTVEECRNLAWPPYYTCVKGFGDIERHLREVKASTAEVIMIGQKGAGKSSLIRSLQTSHGNGTSAALKDPISLSKTSQAFNFEKVTIAGQVFNVVDFSGDETYETSCELALGDYFITIVVVSMWEYSVLCQKDGAEEAILKTLFNWLAFPYLSHPELRAPILVMTHTDRFDGSQISLLKAKFLNSAAEITQKLASENKRIKIFSSEILRFITEENLHCIGLNSTVEELDGLKSAILKSCEHAQNTPNLWKHVQAVVENEPRIGGFVEDVLDMVNDGSREGVIQLDQLQEILTDMHNCGTLLWYKNHPILADFVILKPNSISELLSVFYSHGTETKWHARVERFKFCSHHDSVLGSREFETLVAQFKSSGIMNELLLFYLLRTETAFTTKPLCSFAVNVLKSFGFIADHMQVAAQASYKFLHFVTSPFKLKTSVSEANLVGLTAEMRFRGLAPSRPTYFQWLVATLPDTFQGDQQNITVEKTEIYVLFPLMLIQVSCDDTPSYLRIRLLVSVEEIFCAWQQFVEVTNRILQLTKTKFAGAKLVCEFQCPHCMLKEDDDPIVTLNPPWCELGTALAPRISGIRRVSCKYETNVPAALKHPCDELTDAEIEKLKDYVTILKSEPGKDSCSDGNQPFAVNEQVSLLDSATTDYTSPNDTDIDQFPEELLQDIRKLFKQHASSSPVELLHPHDNRHLIIMGIRIQGMRPDLDELSKRFPTFKFSLQEKGSSLYTSQFGSKSPAEVVRKVPRGLRAKEWMTDQSATVELLISAEEMSKENPKPHGVVFAVLPAHLLLQSGEPEAYASAHNKIAISRNEVEGRSTRTRFVIHAQNGSKGIDLRHPPLFCYRQWFSAQSMSPHRDTNDNELAQGGHVHDCPVEECPAVHNGECHHLYMNDMALMHLEMEDAEQLYQVVKNAQPQRVEKLRKIESKESVEKICRRKHKVVIGEAKGHLIRMPSQILKNEETDRKYGIHLPFILTSTDENNEKHKLQPGDCGLILYYESGRGDCKPMGLFVGVLLEGQVCDEPVYQAIILSQAFKDIEFDYPYQLRNIRLFQTPHDGSSHDAAEAGAADATFEHTKRVGGGRSGPRPPQFWAERRYWPN